GIRDRNVTGVQTCALPISSVARPASGAATTAASRNASAAAYPLIARSCIVTLCPFRTDLARRETLNASGRGPRRRIAGTGHYAQIGRASCRERGWSGERLR